MITMDIFNNDAFALTSMLEPVNRMPTMPGFLGSLGLFNAEPVATDTVGIGQKNGRLALIKTTLRAAPIEMAEPEAKNIRNFRIPRIAKGDTLRAHEIANVRPEVGSTDVEAVAAIIARKQAELKQDVEYTFEHHRLGALQGLLLDSDGSTLVDFYSEWGVTPSADIVLNLPSATGGELRTQITNSIHRALIRASQAGTAVSRVIGLAGDNFYDSLIANPEVRETYLNWTAAADLRQAQPFSTFRYGGVDWINYQGSDDNSTIAIDPDEAIIFPMGVPGMFRHVMGPGETFDTINRMGREVYPLIVRDKDRDMWVQPEIYSYPLMLNTRPDLVLTATIGV